MRIEWHVDQNDVARVRALINQQSANPLVCDRRKRNLAERKCEVTRERFWRAMVCMRLTTRQLSGPGRVVTKFHGTRPFPLDYAKTLENRQELKKFILDTLVKYNIERDRKIISNQLAQNFYDLEQGEWQYTIDQCNRLISPALRRDEIEVANIVAEFRGFGPKQSRNVLQALGLTRYEIPIDSRVTRWLNELKFPFKLSATALQDENYYTLISDGVQYLCEAAQVYPCILDAAIFSANDSGTWKVEELIF